MIDHATFSFNFFFSPMWFPLWSSCAHFHWQQHTGSLRYQSSTTWKLKEMSVCWCGSWTHMPVQVSCDILVLHEHWHCSHPQTFPPFKQSGWKVQKLSNALLIVHDYTICSGVGRCWEIGGHWARAGRVPTWSTENFLTYFSARWRITLS